MSHSSPLIFLTAGESSGDLLGARLMARLKERTGGNVRFAGIGGPEMEAEGLQSLFPMRDLAVMGLAEVLPRIPHLLRRIRQTIQAIREQQPSILVTIDSPDFSFRVARRVAGSGIPLVHYVAPTVWAWRPGRAKSIAQFLDHLLALYPFEPPYFEAVGLPCSFVGHPVIESGAGKGDGFAFRRANGIESDQPLLLLLPGSRRSEITRLLPVFVETLKRLQARHPNLQVVVPTVPHVAELVTAGLAGAPLAPRVIIDQTQKFAAFAAADVALAASGTVTLELALSSLPTVVAYKVAPLTAAIVRRMLRTKFVALPNIILGREAMPELLQENCTPEATTAAVDLLLSDPGQRTAQRRAAEEVARALGSGGVLPSARAADIVLTLSAPSGSLRHSA